MLIAKYVVWILQKKKKSMLREKTKQYTQGIVYFCLEFRAMNIVARC